MRSARRLASLLTRSWDPEPGPLDVPGDAIRDLVPLLLGTGAAALAWYRIQRSAPDVAANLPELHQAYRLHALQSALRLRGLGIVTATLREAGVDAILVKGWSVARLYPEAGLRPYGDIDLVVRESDLARAQLVLASDTLREYNADLHGGTAHLTDRTFETLFEGSRVLTTGDVSVRTPSAEDQLRILAFHALYHGIWRPLWLCDLGAFLAAEGSGLDWDDLLGRDPKRARWISCVLRLGESLLGADLSSAPDAVRAAVLPRWLEPAVLRQWESTARWPERTNLARALADHPRDALALLRARWPDPIRASVYCRAPFDRTPRFPFQVVYALTRSAKIARQVVGSLGPTRTVG